MKELVSNLKLSWHFCKDQKFNFIKYLICNIIHVLISVVIPIVSSKMIIALTENELHQLLLIGLVIFLVENLRNIINYFSARYSQLIYRETFIKIQLQLGKEILKLENKEVDDKGTGTFIQRLTNDSSRIANIFNMLNMNMFNIITDLGILGAIFAINKLVFVFMIVVILVLYLIENTRVKRYAEQDKKFRDKNDKVSSFVGELVRGMRDIKMLNSEESFTSELYTKLVDLNATRYNMGKTERKFRLLGGFTRDLIDLLLIVILVILIIDGNLEVASALVIYNYSSKLPSMVHYVGSLLDHIKDFNLSSSRIFSIINENEFRKEKFGSKHLDVVSGDFEFKDVFFGYTDENILKNISFKINANETVAFVGKSGAGKTTLFNLICKMYDIKSGSILVDGININELDKDTIRGNITIISQNPYIFNFSIRDNLKLVKEDLTEEEMINACKLSCLHDFIMSLPNKYDTVVGEGGVNLSGGQKQRLAIARALIQKTEIILFDEATSALDNETQAHIQQAINNMKNEYTILIIAHRLSTIVNCDRILFLNNGCIEQEGTHEELLNTNAEYRKLYELELMKE